MVIAEGDRERLSAIPITLTCPLGHQVQTGISLWEVKFLSEHPGQVIKALCGTCNIHFEKTPQEVLQAVSA